MMTKTIFFYALFYSSVCFKFSISQDTITPNKSIVDGDTLFSPNRRFALGFFSPGTSKNRFLGIWYRATPDVVVWVANRNNPILDSGGTIAISKNGELGLFNRTRFAIWRSNSSRIAVNPVGKLLDTGNFVVLDTSTDYENRVWQSFDFPSQTRLPGMKITETSYLTSWRTDDDPSVGDFSHRIENHGLAQTVVVSKSKKHFRSGTWNGVRFSGLPVKNGSKSPFYARNYEFNGDHLISISESYNSSVITRQSLNQSGSLLRYIMDEKSQQWDLIHMEPNDPCDNYAYCGANSICIISESPMCQCLHGFTPKSQSKWDVLEWSSGCVRKENLSCNSEEGFLKVESVKLPDLLSVWVNTNMSLDECKDKCLKNCSCTAYANAYVSGGGRGCLIWFGDLVDIREFRVKGSDQNIYIRLTASELDINISAHGKRKVGKIVLVSIVPGMIILGLVSGYVFMKITSKRKEMKRKEEDLELPLFDLATIALATNNFSPANMIGQGGFGLVYKGILSMKQEIAVKRLSKNSRQGLQEFKNEIVSISKLQHRNLVKLLGCCIQGEERMLIYEYMSNKSLDYYIFDHKRINLLAWRKRFDIIMGIARGLLYLHQDSRVRIIHRDLKASNVLLDGDLIPKISDFGLARICKGDQSYGKTKRVIGTYGYMSPEYAIDGKFSTKSDVFSMGVLLLEIVSGQRSRSFCHPNHHHSLFGHAWLLWKEDRGLELVDECLGDSYEVSEARRCIQVGLLCVQKLPEDRPAMSSVVFMLGNEEAILPQPKEPGFFVERCAANTESSTKYSNHIETITILEAR